MFWCKKPRDKIPSYEEFATSFPDHPAVQWVEQRNTERRLLLLLSEIVSSNQELLAISEVDRSKINELRLKLYGDRDA